MYPDIPLYPNTRAGGFTRSSSAKVTCRRRISHHDPLHISFFDHNYKFLCFLDGLRCGRSVEVTA